MSAARIAQHKSRRVRGNADPVEDGSDSELCSPARGDSVDALAQALVPLVLAGTRLPASTGVVLYVVIEQRISRMDLDGLGAALAERFASKVASSVRTVDLVETLVSRAEAALSERFSACIANRLLTGP